MLIVSKSRQNAYFHQLIAEVILYCHKFVSCTVVGEGDSFNAQSSAFTTCQM